jgi:hypothetical protein
MCQSELPRFAWLPSVYLTAMPDILRQAVTRYVRLFASNIEQLEYEVEKALGFEPRCYDNFKNRT